MMSWFKKNSEKIVDAVTSAGDKLFHTREEKADFYRQVSTQVIDYAQKSMDENTIRSRTRRWLAISIMISYLLLLINGAMCLFFDKLRSNSSPLLAIAKELTPLAMAVSIFYFGSYGLMNILNKKK